MEDLDRLSLELKLRNFSQKTVKAYKFRVGKFLSTIGKPAVEVSDLELKEYVAGLLDREGPESVAQAISALKFFYLSVHKRDLVIPYPARPKSLPEVLTV